MRLPVIQGLIDRRLLINYRACPETVQKLLPPPFRPQLAGGYAIVGLCLIRLRQVRPVGVPAILGIGSENAAHRVAVEWRAGGVWRSGVYILRRDTNSWLNVVAGGRIFPGVHHHSAFSVEETERQVQVQFRAADRVVRARVRGCVTSEWPADSAFPSLAEASAFFAAGSLGYSPSAGGQLQGLELDCQSWRAQAFALDAVHSSFFEDEQRFPPGTIELDNGLIMRGITHQWRASREIPQADEDAACAEIACSECV